MTILEKKFFILGIILLLIGIISFILRNMVYSLWYSLLFMQPDNPFPTTIGFIFKLLLTFLLVIGADYFYSIYYPESNKNDKRLFDFFIFFILLLMNIGSVAILLKNLI